MPRVRVLRTAGAVGRGDRRASEHGGLSPVQVRGSVSQGHRGPSDQAPDAGRPARSGKGPRRVGSARAVRGPSGGAVGGLEEHPARVAPAGMGPIPPVARVPWPVHLLGRRRETHTDGSLGPNATRLAGLSATGIDYPEVPSSREQPGITLESRDLGVD
jgi:hypothetical protein